MRATVALSTAVALAAVIPASVRALELHGNLGAGYTQVDTWTPSTERLSVPRLVLDANLDASGFVSSPRIFTWSAGGGYQRVRQSSLDRTDVTSVLGFHLHLGVLDTTSSAVALSVDAARATNDYSTTLGGTALTGTTTENVYGAALAVRPTGRPAVRLGGSYRTSSNTGFGRTETDETTKRLTAGFTHGPGPFSLSGDYELLWNDGTLAAANYDRKTLRLNGGVSLSQNAQGYLTAIDEKRTPGTYSPTSPATELDYVAAGYRWQDASFVGSTQYVYSHMSLSAPSTLTRDAIGQGISAVGERILSPEWRGQASVELSLNQARLGLQEERSAGQTVGLMGRWSRTAALGASEWAAELGPLFGLLEPAGGGTDFGYGLHGRGRWGRQTIGQRLGAEYAIEFADNLHGTPGWTLTQHVTGEAERELDRDTRVRASLTVAAARAHVDLFGSNATRDVLFTGTISRRRGQVGIEAGLRDGASSAVQMGGGDGLFIPAPFQSHSRYVGLNGGLGLTSHLNAFARVRYASLSAPEVPDQREASATGGFGYAYGQFLFTLEDRYIAGGTSNLDNRSNVIMIVASRALGARF